MYVLFDSCSKAEPDKPFDVRVSNETVRLSKQNPGDKYWRGTTLNSFAIKNDRTLKIDVQEMPNARTACNVAPEPYDAGACVALYTVKCEQLWMLNVESVPKKAQATVRYERKPAATTVLPCEPLPALNEPHAIELARTESLLVTVEIRKGQLVAVPLSLSSFGRKTKVNFLEVAKTTIEDTAVSTSRAIDALTKAQIENVLEKLEFTREVSPP